MKKYLLLFTLLLAFCLPRGANAQEIVTIGTGTTSNYITPFNNYYKNAWTQMIYPASQITATGNITSISFQVAVVPTSNHPFSSLTIYMGISQDSVNSSNISWLSMSELTEVYSATNFNSPTATGWQTFNLTTPFPYDGTGHLVIVTSQSMPNYSSELKYYYTEGATNCCMYRRKDSDTSYAQHPGANTGTFSNQLPNLQMTINTNAVFCNGATSITASNITEDGATLTWAGGSGLYNVEYKKTSEETWTTLLTNSDQLTVDLTNLTPATDYRAKVKSVCDDDESAWLGVSFTTECPYMTGYFEENFDNYTGTTTASTNNLPNCWNYINSTTYNSYKGYPIIYSTGASSTPNCLRFYSSYSSSTNYDPQPQYAILPPMENLAGKGVTLKAKGYNVNSTFKIGTMSNPNDAGTFTLISEQALTTSYQEFEYTIPATTDEYLAIMIDGASSSRTTNSVYIDDIVIVACPAPSAPVLSNPDTNGVTIHWTENGDATSWQLTAQFGSYQLPFNTVNDTTFPLYNSEVFQENTTYTGTVGVRASCGNGEYSPWTYANLSFTTLAACPAPENLAVAEDGISGSSATLAWTAGGEANDSYLVHYRTPASFDGVSETFGTSLPSGWERKAGLLSDVMEGTALSNTSQWSFGSNNGVFDNHARINIYGTERKGWLITPAFTVPQGASFNFDLALTAYNGTGAASGTCDDDRFVVLVYANDAWTILREWNNSGSNDVYNNIPTAGQNVSIDLSNYENQTVKIAFYGESTVSGNGDNNLHIDNVAIGLPIAAGDWHIATASDTVVTLTELEPETEYEAFVTADCGNDESEPSDNLHFTTVAVCQTPDHLAANNVTETEATISWRTYGLDMFSMRYSTDGENWTLLALPAGITSPFTISELTANTLYYVQVQPLCAAQDVWSQTLQFRTACSAVTQFPWSEDFESYNSGNFNAPCWVNEHIEGNGTYLFTIQTNSVGGNSTHMLQLTDQAIGTMTKLVLPVMTFPNGNYQFTFDVYRGNNTYNDSYASEGIRVFASVDGEIEGATELAFIPRQYTVGNDIIPAVEAVGWYTYELPIPMSGTCYIILRGESQYCTATYMDNFVVEMAPTCRKVNGLEVVSGSVTTCGAQIDWTDNTEDQNAWQIAFVSEPVTDMEELNTLSSYTDVNAHPYTYEGLGHDTTVYAYVRANCGDGDYSQWVGPVQITTIAPQAPIGLEVSDLTSFSATVSWNGSAANCNHASYELYLGETTEAPANDVQQGVTSEVTATSHTFNNLNPDTYYYVWVRDNCGTDGTSAWSQMATIHTTLFCPAPTSLAVAEGSITATEATLTWTAGGEANNTYNVYYRIPAYVVGGIDEGFEGGTMPDGWTVEGNACKVNPGYGYNGIAPHGGYYNITFSHKNTGDQTYLISPLMDLSGLNEASLSFAYINYGWAGDIDRLYVYYRVGGGEWNEIWNTTEEHQTWNEATVTLPNLAAKYQIAFKMVDRYGHGVGLDDIHVGNPVLIPATEWALAGTTTDTFYTLSSLAEETAYETMVTANCDESVSTGDIVPFTTVSACEAPTNVTVVASTITDNSATVTWHGWQDAFTLRYYADGGDTTYLVNIGDTTYTLDNLNGSTTYYVQVSAANCADDWSAVQSFSTACPALQTLPYTYDFEDASPWSCWTTISGTVDRAESGPGNYVNNGSYSMRFKGMQDNYVAMPQFSQDLSSLQLKFWVRPEGSYNSGTLEVGYMTDLTDLETFVAVASYPNATTPPTFEQKTLYFLEAPQGATIVFRQIYATMNWFWHVDDVEVTAMGPDFCFPVENLTFDELAAHSVKLTWDLIDETQEEWVVQYADNENFENPQSVVANIHDAFEISGLTPLTRYWVRVSANCGTNSSEWSLAKDFYTSEACPAPVMNGEVSTDVFSAHVQWNGSSDEYTLRYRTTEHLNAVFTEGFENGIGGWSLVDCEEQTGIQSNSPLSGSGVFTFSWGINPPQYLISPELTGINEDMLLEFYYKNDEYYSYSETFQVGFSATDIAIASFVFGDEYLASDGQWHHYSETIPAGTKYICWKLNSDDQYLLYIDDIAVGTLVSAGEWTTVEGIADSTDYLIEGLADGTEYEVQVLGVCTEEDPETYHWSNLVSFTTIEAYTVYLYEGTGNCETLSLRGDVVALPVASAPCDDWDFIGWATAPVYNTTTEPTVLEFASNYYPTEDTNMYAIYKSAENIYSTFPTCVYTQLNVEETFESYSGEAGEHRTGVKPLGWAVIDQETPTTWKGRPQVYDFAYYAHESEKSLLMDSVTILIMPELDPTITSFDNLKMRLFVRQRYSSQMLQVGVVSNPDDPSTFEVVTTINNTIYSGASAAVEQHVVNFSTYTGSGRYIAFKNIYDEDNINHGQKSFNYIDDILLYTDEYVEDPECEIDLTYTQDFEDVEIGGQPDCWKLVREEVNMTEATRPHVVGGSASYAWSGVNSLYMGLRGMYAMPRMAEEVDMSTVRMELYVKQTNALHQLEVGLMSDLNDYSTYVPVTVIDNENSAMTRHVVDFSNYADAGRYIVFRNTLEEGATGQRSYNYIDDIRFLTEDNGCVLTPTYTQNFEDLTAGSASASDLEPCWTLAHRDVVMNESMKPQIVSGNGGQVLYLSGRGYYAMPVLAPGYDISVLQLEFDLKQHNKASMSLEVGVATDLNDVVNTFELVETIHNGASSWKHIVVDLSQYQGNGRYIVFHNIATSGSRSYNYLDNIMVGTPDELALSLATETVEETSDLEDVESGEIEEIANPTGVESYALDNLTVYPNPTTGTLHIDAVDVTRVEVYSQMGQLVAMFDHQRDLDLGNLTSGVYMLRVTLPAGVAIRKVIKR